MPRGRPAKNDGNKAVPFFITIHPDTMAELEEYSAELKKRTPGLTVTRQDALRAVLAAWTASRKKRS